MKNICRILFSLFLSPMPNLKKGKGKLLGYTLVELSISTSIIAMLAVGGLALLQKKNDTAQATETSAKLVKIETALKGFIRVKGYIPCPALPASLESSSSFGTSVSYNSNTKLCDGSSLAYETGMVPVRTLGLSDDNAYDGWGRKFTYRSASASGSVSDFGNDNFKGNIAIIDVKGIHKTNINEPAPNNDGAIYVIISHGANGKSAAYRRNDNTAPTGASGVEAKNTDHSRNVYIQSNKTNIFDDIVLFGTKARLSRANVAESPIRIDDKTCDTAQSIANDGRSTLNNYAASNSNAYTARADTIFKSASLLSNLCKNRKVAETLKPDRIKGLSLWLDAADKATLFTGSNCITGGKPANNATIGCWKDKSGNALDVTGVAQYNSNIQNGKAVLTFNGSNASLSRANVAYSSIASSNEVSMFFVQKYSSPTHNSSTMYWSNGVTRINSHLLQGDGGMKFDFGTCCSLGNSRIQYTPSGFNDVWNIISEIRKSDNTANMFLNGTNVASSSSATDTVTGTGELDIGSIAGSYYNLKGQIGEVLIYKNSLSTLERNKIEEYLSDKWAITLSSSTSTCVGGMVFQKTNDNPQGSCQCPTGQVYLRDLRTANACYSTITSTLLNSCVSASSAPTYSSTPDKSGMILWLDANDCTTLTLASGGTTSPVSAWADKSGAGNNATQGTIANMPLYIKNAQNSLPVIRFDGASDNMTVPINISRSVMPNVTISTVYKRRSGGSSSQQALWGQDNGSWDRFALLVYPSVSKGISNGSGIQLLSRIANHDTWQIFTASLNSNTGTSNVWINGQTTFPNGFTESVGDAGNNTLMIGNIGTIGSYYANVDIGEMIIYNYSISNNQRSTLESYFSSKWAIPLLPTDINPTNLKLWLDAADASTIYSSSDCGTLASAWGNVGCWKDKSGNGNNATQATTASQPIYGFGTQNTNPIIKFNSSNSTQLATSRMIQDDFTIFLATNTSTTGNTGSSSGQWYNCSGIFDTYVGASTNDFGLSACNNGSILTGGGNPDTSFAPYDSGPNGTLRIINITRYKTDRSLVISAGNPIDSSGGSYLNNASLSASSRITLGSLQTNSNYYNGGIAEIVVYNISSLSAANYLSIDRYLNDKWGGTMVEYGD